MRVVQAVELVLISILRDTIAVAVDALVQHITYLNDSVVMVIQNHSTVVLGVGIGVHLSQGRSLLVGLYHLTRHVLLGCVKALAIKANY